MKRFFLLLTLAASAALAQVTLPWTDVDKTGSSLANLQTRSASDLNSGTLPAARLPAFTGDATSSAGSSALTLATVNSNVGSFGSATQIPVVTINGKGLITSASVTTVTPAWSSITDKPTTISGHGFSDVSAFALTVLDDGDGGAFRATIGADNASNLTSGTVAAARGGAGTVSGIMKANGSGVVSAAAAGTDYLAPSGSGAALTGITGGQVANTAAGNLAATTVQAAINELDSEKSRTSALDLRYASYLAETQASHLVAYQDSSVWIENFADLSGWTVAHGQVSGGRFFADASFAANPNGANRSFVVPAGQSARIVSSINHVATASGLVLVGVSKDSAGGAPTAGGVNFFGIAIQSGVGASYWLAGTGTLLDASPPTGLLQVVIAIDASWISASLSNADGSWQAVARIDRATFGDINNVAIYNTDTRQLSGSSIGPVGARLGTPTVTPRTGIEGLGAAVISTRVSANNDARIILPPSYDSRRPAPLVIVAHGNGETQDLVYTNANLRAVVTAFSSAGYIVASGYYRGNNWGNQNGVDDLVALHDYVVGKYSISGVGLLGVSMGGLTTLNTIAQRKIPALAWCGIYPVVSLSSLYANPTYVTPIESAYGFSGGANYAAATAGYDPALRRGSDFLGLPMLMFASSGDTAVPRATNADVLAVAVASTADSVTVVSCSGNHGDASHFQPSEVVSFFNRSFGRSR